LTCLSNSFLLFCVFTTSSKFSSRLLLSKLNWSFDYWLSSLSIFRILLFSSSTSSPLLFLYSPLPLPSFSPIPEFSCSLIPCTGFTSYELIWFKLLKLAGFTLDSSSSASYSISLSSLLVNRSTFSTSFWALLAKMIWSPSSSSSSTLFSPWVNDSFAISYWSIFWIELSSMIGCMLSFLFKFFIGVSP